MLFRLITLLCFISFPLTSSYANGHSDDSSASGKNARLIMSDAFVRKTINSFKPLFSENPILQNTDSLEGDFKIFIPTEKNINLLINILRNDPDSLVEISKTILGHRIINVTSSQLKDNVYFNVHEIITEIMRKALNKYGHKKSLIKRMLSGIKNDSKFYDKNLLFHKIIFINTLFSMYVNSKQDKDYDMCISDFFSQYEHSLKTLFGYDIHLKDFEKFIYTGNLIFPFVLLTYSPEKMAFKNILNIQKYYPITYNVYLKLKTEINFSIEHILNFSPIFAATSLLSIFTSEFISSSDKKYIDQLARSIVDADYTFNGEPLDIYLKLAIAEISKEHEALFNKSVPYLNLPSEISTSDLYESTDPASSQQIVFSAGGFLLRSIAINAKNMFEYIIQLYHTGIIEIETTTFFNATINAILYDRKTFLKSLLDIYEISSNDVFMQYAFDLAISNQKFIMANMILKVFPDAIETTSQGDSKKKTIPTSIKQDLRFNIYRSFNQAPNCKDFFNKEDDKKD